MQRHGFGDPRHKLVSFYELIIVLNLKTSLREDTPENKSQYAKLPKSLRDVMDKIDDAIELGTERALAEGYISGKVNNDFQVFGDTAYRDLNHHEWTDLARISESRLASLGWMTGFNGWDYVEGDIKFINPLGSLWSPEE